MVESQSGATGQAASPADGSIERERNPRGTTLCSLVEVLGGVLVRGDPSADVTGVAALEAAGPSSVAFVSKPKYLARLATTHAGAVIIGSDLLRRSIDQVPATAAVIEVPDAYVAFARVAQHFSKEAPAPLGVHPSAVVDPSAILGERVSIGPLAVVGPGACLGDGAILHAGAHLGAHSRVGAETVLHERVVVRYGCTIGDRCIVHAGAVIGADGFGFAQDGVGSEVDHVKIPQVGDVVIEDDVEIGANTCIDRAALGTTRIGAGSKIDNLVQVGHNVEIGPRCIVIAQAGIAGSTKLGRRAILAAQSGVAGHLEIGEAAIVYAQAGVMQSVPPGGHVVGTPARPKGEFFRSVARIAKLDALVARVKRLERLLEVGERSEARTEPAIAPSDSPIPSATHAAAPHAATPTPTPSTAASSGALEGDPDRSEVRPGSGRVESVRAATSPSARSPSARVRAASAPAGASPGSHDPQVKRSSR